MVKQFAAPVPRTISLTGSDDRRLIWRCALVNTRSYKLDATATHPYPLPPRRTAFFCREIVGGLMH